jgi:hypothetical protein
MKPRENKNELNLNLAVAVEKGEDGEPSFVVLAANLGPVSVDMAMPAEQAKDLAGVLAEAASFTEVQNVGEQNAEELAKPPAQNAAQPRVCRICRKPIDDNIANHPFLCGTCLRELKS